MQGKHSMPMMPGNGGRAPYLSDETIPGATSLSGFEAAAVTCATTALLFYIHDHDASSIVLSDARN